MSFLRRRATRLNAVKIPARATFPIEDKYTQKRGDVNDVKPVRKGPLEVGRADPKHVRDWPRDGNGMPLDFEDMPIG